MAPGPTSEPGPLLWEITKSGKRSHVLALPPPGVIPDEWPQLVWNTLDASRTLVVVEDETKVSAGTLALLSPVPEGRALSQQLTASDWKRLRTELEGINVSRGRIDRAQPLFVGIQLEHRGLIGTRFLPNRALVRYARGRRLPIVVLDPTGDAMQLALQVHGTKYLQSVVRNVRRTRKAARQRVRLYRAGDAQRLARTTAAPLPHEHDDDAVAVEYTNLPSAKWMGQIELELAGGGAFLALGHAHVLGSHGLVAELRKLGYSVRRVGNGTPATPTTRNA